MLGSKLQGPLIAAFCLLVVAGCDQARSSDPLLTPIASAQERLTPGSLTPEPSVAIAIGAIQPQTTLVLTETIKQPNCGGSIDVESEVSRERQIERVMSMEAGVELSAEGQVGVLGTHVNLGTTIANRLGYTYGSSETIRRTIILGARIGTDMRHTLQIQEISQVGSVTITVDGEQKALPFQFRSDFALQLIESRDTGCPTLLSPSNELRILGASVASLADYDEGLADDPNQRDSPLIDIRVASSSQSIFITDSRLAVKQRVEFESCLPQIGSSALEPLMQMISYREQAPFALLPDAVYTFELAEQQVPYTKTVDVSQYILPTEPDRFGLVIDAQESAGVVAILANVMIVYQILGSTSEDAYEIATNDLLIIFPTDVEGLESRLEQSFLTGSDALNLNDPTLKACVERNVTAAETLLALPAIGPWQSANLQSHLSQAKVLLE